MNHIEILINRYSALGVCRNEIEKAVQLIVKMREKEGKLLLCGNGGSSADCCHIAGEMMKGFLLTRTPSYEEQKRFVDAGISSELTAKIQKGVCCLPLPEMSAVLSAFANDVDPKLTYAQLVYASGNKRDVFWGISTSGNSKNVVLAAQVAKALEIQTIALTGSNGGDLAEICDIAIKAPATETYQIQEYHLPIYHTICAEVEKRLFGTYK